MQAQTPFSKSAEVKDQLESADLYQLSSCWVLQVMLSDSIINSLW